MPTIRVLIADDHRLMRRSLRQICEIEGGFEVVGEACNGLEAVALTSELQPDVILMDIKMPGLDGVEATGQILSQYPHIGVIMLTVHSQDRHIVEAIKMGARGYLLKNTDEETLIEAIQVVYQGQALSDPLVTSKVFHQFRRVTQNMAVGQVERLTEAEMAVLRLVAQGLDNQAIAKKLVISPKTVSNRLLLIYQKLQVHNRTQAALYALRQGWADLYPDEK